MLLSYKFNIESVISSGFSPQLLQSMDAPNLVSLVKLQTALGQALGSILNKDKNESAQAFADALTVRIFLLVCIVLFTFVCI